MQQPFNQPGGSYGNSPYAVPAPRRGFNWLACCLGCVGIAVIAAIIVGTLIFARVKKAAGPPITAATYKSEFPAGVPIYPGLKFDEAMSAPMRYAGGAVGLIPQAGGVKMRMMVFRSPKPASIVGAWYKKQLVPKGWTIAGAPSAESWQFEKGNDLLLVSEMNQQQGAIMIGVGRNLPKNSRPRIKVTQ